MDLEELLGSKKGFSKGEVVWNRTDSSGTERVRKKCYSAAESKQLLRYPVDRVGFTHRIIMQGRYVLLHQLL